MVLDVDDVYSAQLTPAVAPKERLRSAVEEVITMTGAGRPRKAPEIFAIDAFYTFKRERSQPQPVEALNAAAWRRQVSLIERTRPSSIDLSLQPLGDAGVSDLCRGLLSNVHLTELRLSSVGCGWAGAASVAEVAALGMRMRLLDLSRNHISDVGASHLARPIRSAKALASLSLSGCDIGETGAEALAAAMRGRPSGPLTRLDLSFNPRIHANAAASLRDAAAACRHLSSCDLAGAEAPAEVLAEVQLAVGAGGKREMTGKELWQAGVHSAYTLRFADDTEDADNEAP